MSIVFLEVVFLLIFPIGNFCGFLLCLFLFLLVLVFLGFFWEKYGNVYKELITMLFMKKKWFGAFVFALSILLIGFVVAGGGFNPLPDPFNPIPDPFTGLPGGVTLPGIPDANDLPGAPGLPVPDLPTPNLPNPFPNVFNPIEDPISSALNDAIEDVIEDVLGGCLPGYVSELTTDIDPATRLVSEEVNEMLFDCDSGTSIVLTPVSANLISATSCDPESCTSEMDILDCSVALDERRINEAQLQQCVDDVKGPTAPTVPVISCDVDNCVSNFDVLECSEAFEAGQITSVELETCVDNWAGACSDDDRIMKISAFTDALGALWNDDEYIIDVCYSRHFTNSYTGSNSHDCTGNNFVMGLNAIDDAEVSGLPGVAGFDVDVCYGDLDCSLDWTEMGDSDCKDAGGALIASLNFESGARVYYGRDIANYPYQLCCKSASGGDIINVPNATVPESTTCGDGVINSGEVCDGADLGGATCLSRGYFSGSLACSAGCMVYDTTGCSDPIGSVYWADADGNAIQSANFGDTVLMYVVGKNSGSFDIYEDDAVSDDSIQMGIAGRIRANAFVGEWTIPSMSALSVMTADFDDFKFEIGGTWSDSLSISGVGDSNMTVELISPSCGAYYDEGDVVEIIVEASDLDDVIDGGIMVDGDIVETFSNGRIVFDHVFSIPGDVSVVVTASNDRGKVSRDFSNIMVLDKEAGSYVDGKYVAACILSPEDSSYISGHNVSFDASTTRAIDVVGGVINEILPGSTRLVWEWRFMPDNKKMHFENDASEDPYNFVINFPIAGHNYADLKVDLM
jgi:hypothetical protein